MARLRTLYVYTLIGLLTVFSMASPCVASISLDLKAGIQTLNNPLTLKDTTRTRYEVELAGTTPISDNLEICLGFGGASVSTVKDTYTTYDDYGMIQETLEDKFRTYDLRLGVRLYAISPEKEGSIHPYVGGGVGYYWMVDDWKDTYLQTNPNLKTEDDGNYTLAEGLFPYVIAGVDIPITDQAALLFEYKHDFQKTKDGADYGGDIFTAGLRIRW